MNRKTASKIIIFWTLLMSIPCFGSDGSNKCPDYYSEKCTKQIKSDIESSRYGSASLNSELQCYNSKGKGNVNALNERGLTLRALGCYYSYMTEKFLGNHLRSSASLEQANSLVKFGCLYNMSWLCKLSEDILDLEKISLRSEIKEDMKELTSAISGKKVYLKIFSEKILPVEIKTFYENFFKEELAKEDITIEPCDECTKFESDKNNLSIIISHIGGRLSIEVSPSAQMKKDTFIRKNMATLV